MGDADELAKWCDDYLAANPITDEERGTVEIMKLRILLEQLDGLAQRVQEIGVYTPDELPPDKTE